nr:unnamed protein product [Haemonchus contortus]
MDNLVDLVQEDKKGTHLVPGGQGVFSNGGFGVQWQNPYGAAGEPFPRGRGGIPFQGSEGSFPSGRGGYPFRGPD